MATTYVKDAGTWKPVKGLYVKDAGTWKTVKQGWVKDAGVWKQFFAGVTISNPLGFNGNTYSDTDPFITNSANCSVSLYSDGTWTVDSGSLGNLASGNWATPTTTGIGSSYWVRYTLNSTSGSSTGTTWTTTTGWLALSSTRTALVTASSPTVNRTRTAAYTVDIASDSAGTTIVSTSTITLTASSQV